MVTVYSKPGCVPCESTKKFLDNEGIEYEVKDIYESEENMQAVKALGFSGVPVIVADGIKPFNGFRPDLLETIEGGK